MPRLTHSFQINGNDYVARKREEVLQVFLPPTFSPVVCGVRWWFLASQRSGRNTRTSLFRVVPCNYRPTETRFRWSIVDGVRLLIYSFTHNKISALRRVLTD